MQTQLYLTPKDHGRPVTLEEFESAGGKEGFRYELIDGRIDVSPIPNFPHEDIRDWIRAVLDAHAAAHPENINHVKAPARVFVPGRRETTAPEPDVAAYQGFPKGRPIRRRRWQDFSPVLVVEILSEDTARKDLVRNRQLYLEVPSIREYWILDPRTDPDRPSLTVYRRRGQNWQQPIVVAPGEVYTTRLLPGLSLLVDPHNGEAIEEDADGRLP
jgi:Uma2 family endonuclease